MFSLEKPEELIKIRLIHSLTNNQFTLQKEIEKLFLAHPDIVVVDKNQEIALLLDIQMKPSPKGEVEELSTLSQLYLQNANHAKDIRFAMSANLKKIAIFKSNSDNCLKPIISFVTTDILSHYEQDFSKKTILYSYFRTLLEAWLRDLAYHWKSEKPPGAKELEKIGLLAKIEDGDTYAKNE
jgi:hypothetical protein